MAGPVQRARFRMDRSLEVAFYILHSPRRLLFPLFHRRVSNVATKSASVDNSYIQ